PDPITASAPMMIPKNLPEVFHQQRCSSGRDRALHVHNGDDASCQEIACSDEKKCPNHASRSVVEIAHSVRTDESSCMPHCVNQSKTRGSRSFAQNCGRHGPEDRIIGEHHSTTEN